MAALVQSVNSSQKPRMRPLRVLHLNGDHEDAGGVLSVIRALQEQSTDGEFEHVLLANPDFRQTRKPELKWLGLEGFWGDLGSHAKLLWGAACSQRRLSKLLAQESFDVLHAHTRGGYLLGMLYCLRSQNRHVLFTNHNYAQRRWLYRLALWVKRFHTVTLTPNMRRHYHLPDRHPRVITISECHRDLFFNLPLAKRHRATTAPVLITGVGNITRWKKWDMVIKAMKQLPAVLQSRIEFRHYGPVTTDPDSRVMLNQMLADIQKYQLGNAVHFCGATGQVATILGETDWFLLPSTNEPCSVALLEALALGCPALVSRSGGNVDIIQEGINGALFEPDDVTSLAHRLEEIATREIKVADPATIRASVADRRASVVARQYEALYRQLAATS